jgi:preprotein translocase subunit YajC
MDFLISNAWAEGGAQTQGDPIMSLLPLIVLFVIFYFLLIRPQAKRAKEHKKMVQSLAKGDEVATNGGVLGTIVEVGENFLVLEVADGVQVKLQRSAVATLFPKGTIKTL